MKDGNREVAITTIDNPYSPFEDFERWFMFDVERGYNTCAYLDRIAITSDAFTEQENKDEIERAIDEIVKYDFLGIYKKVEYFNKPSNTTTRKAA